ncbi:MAG TPA: hypothetical protein DDY78_24265 [Planctomycetales bacterium]|nr:hypothetical protein [Planctomycetales bacterium]
MRLMGLIGLMGLIRICSERRRILASPQRQARASRQGLLALAWRYGLVDFDNPFWNRLMKRA